VKAAHVELAGRGGTPWTVRIAVDHDPALPADPLPAVMIEGDRLLAIENQPLVDHVEHLEERHVRADVARRIGLEPPRGVAVLLPPDIQGQVDLLFFTVSGHGSSSQSWRLLANYL